MAATQASHPHVFEPIAIGGRKLKSRIEVAPAAPFLSGHDGSVSPEYFAYLKALAGSGAGVVTLGVTPVDGPPQVGARVMNIASDLYISDFNEIAELVHSYDALACAELVHVQNMLTPADIVVNETSTEDVELMISQFVDAAGRLIRAGFDMALIHGGHGNVPAMFFNKHINRRTDRFGGSFEGRCQFAREILQGIREAYGDRIALEYRISAEEMTADGSTLGETIDFARSIQQYLDLLHVSRGLLEVDDLVPYINAPTYLPRAMNLPFAAAFKEALNVPVTVVGSFDLDFAEAAIASGQVDMASMIRTVYADPFCIEKSRLGEADRIRPCIRCNTCIDRTHTYQLSVRCAVNPLLGRTLRFAGAGEPRRDGRSARAVVVGGGPSGMQAALTLADRGFAVTLFEASDKLGGQLKLASMSDSKKDIRDYLDWLVRTVCSSDAIEVRLNERADVQTVAALEPDRVVIALGSSPRVLDAGSDESVPVVWVGDAEGRIEGLGKRILVVGGGMTGLEFALEAARKGKEVVVADLCSYDELGRGATAINVRCIKNLLRDLGVEFCCGCGLESVGSTDALLAGAEGEQVRVECDTVVLSLGFVVDRAEVAHFKDAFPRSCAVGDCGGAGGSIYNAVRTAYDKAMAL